jgi:DNA repair exonuclease SbcCD ATPase subunit
LFKQKDDIKELQKTKQVLTHRTMEMKASLEPKEQQIESLKEQLLDMEKIYEFQERTHKNFVAEKEEKLKLLEELDEKIKEEKARTRMHEKTISDFVARIHSVVQTKDEKKYIEELINIYKKFVKPRAGEILDKKRKDPETIEELDRQLKYMEHFIKDFVDTTRKNHTKSLKNIKKRTAENAELIKDLSQMREQKNQNEKDIKRKDMDIQTEFQTKKRIEQELAKIAEQMRTLRTQEDKKLVTGEQLWKERDTQQEQQDRDRRLVSRGKLARGPMFRQKPLGVVKAKIEELVD